MRKSELADAMQHRLGSDCSKSEAVDLVESVLAIMKETLSTDESVKISSFGTFEPRDKKPRMGRNPQTGEPILIEARRVVAFKVSEKLRGKMNNGDGGEEGS